VENLPGKELIALKFIMAELQVVRSFRGFLVW
jgi:hypothetical protein